ncbi:MAG: hypothetical protein ACK2UK_10855 [Candidatus Promineifilaceae bacterium]
MDPKSGIYTTEFWLTAIANIAGAVFAILVIYGILKQEEAELWLALVQAVALAAIPIALAYTNAAYIQGRAEVKTATALKDCDK